MIITKQKLNQSESYFFLLNYLTNMLFFGRFAINLLGSLFIGRLNLYSQGLLAISDAWCIYLKMASTHYPCLQHANCHHCLCWQTVATLNSYQRIKI